MRVREKERHEKTTGNVVGLEVKKRRGEKLFIPPSLNRNTDLKRGYTTHEINQAAAERLPPATCPPGGQTLSEGLLSAEQGVSGRSRQQ